MNDNNDKKIYTSRPPVVVVMGHIDHGKSMILETIRKTKMLDKESGGITQHIGAYEVLHKGRRITFIDTPGHEAFSKMRSRGANVADIAILVVAADEGIKPQTKESYEIIQKNNLPFIVAINKIDKPEANPERVKQELAQENILVESYGGKIPSVNLSAKTGEHLDDLLEIILLMAEIEDLKSDPSASGEGVVIESHLDAKRGRTATLLITNGGFDIGNFLAIGGSVEKIKILENFLGEAIENAQASSPVRIAGLSQIPQVGEKFKSFISREETEKFAASIVSAASLQKAAYVAEGEKPIFNIILKTDMAGSGEALEESLKKIESENIGINILRNETGDINESDAKLAQATKLVTIIGFKVKIDPSARELARISNIHIIRGEIIYQLIDEVKKQISDMIPPEIRRQDIGLVKILKVFKKDSAKQIVGGRVEEGIIKDGARVEIKKKREVVGQGKILELQHNKQKVDMVEKGSEFGVLIESTTAIEEGDVLIIYTEETIKKEL